MSIAEKLTQIAENEQKVYDAGKQAEYDTFWDLFQDNGNRSNYSYAFYLWNDENFNPKYIPLHFAKNMNAFNGSTITSVPPIRLTAYTMNSMFYNATSLENIEMIILDGPTGNASNAFTGCGALRNIRFSGTDAITQSISFQPCPLTNESVQSIIDYLADLTGKTAQTLTLHKDVGDNLTDAQKSAISAKNWTLVY